MGGTKTVKICKIVTRDSYYAIDLDRVVFVEEKGATYYIYLDCKTIIKNPDKQNTNINFKQFIEIWEDHKKTKEEPKKVQVIPIKEEEEDEFIFQINREFNLWYSVDILHYDHTYKNYKAVLICKEE